jgi:lipopolysaccharide/colanic/teichoic acid biosynthesis glycosyltransferase
MSPEIQTNSLSKELYNPLHSVTYVDPAHDRNEHQFHLYDDSPADTFAYRVLKRCFDVGMALLIFPFVVIVGIFVAFLIALDSPGPVLFSQSRLGHGGKYFPVWKFRTMCCNGNEVLERHFDLYPEDRKEWKLNHKLKVDPRVSTFGAFLRRTSLDELPQIWNVLAGDMSLVGPRPIVHEEIEKYGLDYVYYASVKPGITGLWQTSGRSTLSYDQRVALDRFYVENWSFWFELKILARTIRAVARSDGAY